MQGVTHNGCWLPSTQKGRETNNKTAQPTAETKNLPTAEGWGEYLVAAKHSRMHEQLAAFHEWLDPSSHAYRRDLIESMSTRCQNVVPYLSPGILTVVNFNVTVDCHMNSNDMGFTSQFVHGHFTGGDITFRNASFRAPQPSRTMVFLRTAILEHAVLDWSPPAGADWADCYRFSHPVTFPKAYGFIV
ncbi:hypothetical protein HDU88_005672 [Geranomyces variabilis]|nr:hypothetical protein HDU88_005672 [Geranomyces variabilis]